MMRQSMGSSKPIAKRGAKPKKVMRTSIRLNRGNATTNSKWGDVKQPGRPKMSKKSSFPPIQKQPTKRTVYEPSKGAS
ncbi:hypothetical protein DUNSADRAFT_3610 [Dunaliella salina]|uniref:Encoded protein n=1 Tax=Dunaliella salina TaxID=3046 RepID=A0ABQ7FVX9_DUNSA|nr:hypothetical protein DUNSADRAFT_3610 [Dunaliella salina]|eukprot:KAF5826317.1 hypothetical protein DUNSADRAFT_3610 [Dunaliella salina]